MLLLGLSASPFVAAQVSGAARSEALSIGGAPEAGEWSARQHDALVEAVRTGRTAPRVALERIARWHGRQLPDVATLGRVASDGIVWGLQADDPARALAWARSVPTGLIRDYALDAGFRAARMAPDRALEGELLAQMQSRRPSAWETRINHVLWLMDQGDLNGAERALDTLSPEATAGHVELRAAWLDARAALAKAQGRKFEAMGAYSELAEVAPARTYATRESLFLLADQAAPAAAYAQARAAETARPGTFRPIELARLEQAALAQRVQWARAERDQRTGQGAARFAAIDALIPTYDDALARASRQEAEATPPEATSWRTVRLQLAYDRIGALAVRGRSNDVVAAFDALRADGVEPPYYVLSDVAGAWQQLRRSDLAVPLYEAALQDAGDRLPMPSDTHVGLVYAYLDTARFEDADRLLARLEQATPPTVRRSPERMRPNPEYSQVRNLRALYQLYTDDAAAAERSFDALVASSPLNAGFRTGQAETARLRRHPDAALARYQETLTDHPNDVPARAGYASTLLEAGHLREGRVLADALRIEAPESIAARNAGQQRDAVFAPRLDIDAEAGEDGGALANHEWRVDSRLTSGWWQDRWRMFYRQVAARGDTNIGDVRYVRGGLGMQWQSERWLLTGELHQANQGPYRTGVALGASWRASDAWRFAAEFDSDSIETPYKARRSGVGAHSLGASATWVANESRSVEARWQRMDFSDGNLRDAFGVDWNERLITTPRFQLDGTLGAETARSDRQDVAYFSPSSESALQLGLAARYLTWKRDDRRWVQVVQVSGGSYRQAGFGGGPLWSVRYAHEWDFGPALRLRYGLGISGHPYDGVREQRKFVFLNLSVPLK